VPKKYLKGKSYLSAVIQLAHYLSGGRLYKALLWREGSKGTGDKEYVKGLEDLALGSSW
jgi:hypothetical protein